MHPGSPSDPSQTAAAEAKPRYIYSILKPHGQSFRRQVRLLLSDATLSFVYSILKPHSQSSRSPVRLLLSEATPSYVVVVVVWGTWSFGMYDHGLRFLLTFMPTLLTLCRSFARTYRGSGSLSTLPWTPHQLTAEVYPHRVSTSVSAWDYLASTHANTSTVKHSGPASLPRKSQAARNGAILLGQAAATFLQQYWVLAFCLCIHKQFELICMYTQPVHTSSSVYTHMSTYTYMYM